MTIDEEENEGEDDGVARRKERDVPGVELTTMIIRLAAIVDESDWCQIEETERDKQRHVMQQESQEFERQ